MSGGENHPGDGNRSGHPAGGGLAIWKGGILMKRVFVILAAAAAGLGMAAAIIAAAVNRRDNC